jgi:tetratricopeptide (TPR) repeat protein
LISTKGKAILSHPKRRKFVNFELINRGKAEINSGNPKEAIVHFDEAIKLNRHDQDAYEFRGIAKEKLGDFEGAIKDLTEAIRIAHHKRVYYHRGTVYYMNARNKPHALGVPPYPMRVSQRKAWVYLNPNRRYNDISPGKRKKNSKSIP